ncbi:hypothetical protein [Nitrosovibrio sp. Nv4]|nr:hypothetical protein [Nitrosovibrio sp. Nv4]
MLTFLAALLGIAMVLVMTPALIGAILKHSDALPIVGIMFAAIIIFGVIW